MEFSVKEFIGQIFGGLASIVIFAIWAVIAAGGLYWFWMAIQIGSFVMFVIGCFPPTGLLFATPVGAWSLLFGIPDWIFDWFA
jgi:hypothetical protein